jgi:branched-subunit amino acid transport protein
MFSLIPAAIKVHHVLSPDITLPFLIVTVTFEVAPELVILNLTTELPVSADKVLPFKSIVKLTALVIFNAFCPYAGLVTSTSFINVIVSPS